MKYIVMDSQAKMPASCWGRYRHVAVVELDQAEVFKRRLEGRRTTPKQINPRHRLVRRIVWDSGPVHCGETEFCAFYRAYSHALDLARELEEEERSGSSHTHQTAGGAECLA